MSLIRDTFFALIQKEGEHLKRDFHVRRLGIFGSCVRGEESLNSDVDVLVEFEEKSFDNFMNLKFFLEEKLKRPVDLVVAEAIKPAIRDRVLAEVRYAA